MPRAIPEPLYTIMRINLVLLFLVFLGCDNLSKSKDFNNTDIDYSLIQGIWGSKNSGENGDIRFTSSEFYVVDHFETSNYVIQENLITIQGSEFYKKGVILKVSKDSLRINWTQPEMLVDYWKFKN